MDTYAKKVISQVFIEDFILFPCEVGRYQHKHKTFVCFKADAQIIATKWKKEIKTFALQMFNLCQYSAYQ